MLYLLRTVKCISESTIFTVYLYTLKAHSISSNVAQYWMEILNKDFNTMRMFIQYCATLDEIEWGFRLLRKTVKTVLSKIHFTVRNKYSIVWNIQWIQHLLQLWLHMIFWTSFVLLTSFELWTLMLDPTSSWTVCVSVGSANIVSLFLSGT
jgi:hypothetical protein